MPRTKELYQSIDAVNDTDANGNPAGGYVNAKGLSIEWQNGPCPDGVEPNGAWVQTVIRACIQRIEAYQNSKYKCRENALAITKLEEAFLWLDYRAKRRMDRGVLGEHIE